MNEREAFLRAITSNEDDELVRLVFADWLDDHGEHEEAERQRKIPGAKRWLDDLRTELNAARPEGAEVPLDRLLDFGRNVSATPDTNIEVESGIPGAYAIVRAIRDRIPEFWRAWAAVTGLPLSPDIELKCYYSSGYCCANEIYPDTHEGGPKSAEFIRNQESHARMKEAEKEFQWMMEQGEEEFRARLEEESQALRQQKFEMIQDELEKDRP